MLYHLARQRRILRIQDFTLGRDTMRYISTRGGIVPLSFTEAVMMGLATDGGLLLPETLPRTDAATLARWQDLPYPELAFEVMRLFVGDIPEGDFRELIRRAYATFSHPAVTPVVERDGLHILELFHGPTLAFKDVALQLLGNLFEYLLAKSGGHMNILGATSGDTGSAAIHGVRGRKGINIFILHPHKRVSEIQELQMTTVIDPNVFNLAVRGTFDDGQAIVKTIFNDLAFKEKHQLGAVNSINWARILAQVVYYVYAFLQVSGKTGAATVDFAVPTGNFGDIFAGFVARTLLPAGAIGRLVLATNENDLLTRFVLQGDYSLGTVVPTSSPSMDIQVASNFERYLYYLYGEDAGRTAAAMAEFAKTGALRFSAAEQETVRQTFAAQCVNEAETVATIRDFHARTGYVLDPHTAVGVAAAHSCRTAGRPMVCLATAHPAKFGTVVRQALGQDPDMPPALAALAGQERRCTVIDANVAAVQQFIDQHAI